MNDLNKNVFINCSYTSEFSKLLKGLVFTVIFLGYEPFLTMGNTDCSVGRLDKIKKLIKESRISIHDLSNIKSSKKKQFYRLNMSFELGLDFGYKYYSNDGNDKKFLVLGGNEYDYMKALSDLNGNDIKYHKEDIENLIKSTRNWFIENEEIECIYSATQLHYYYCDFNARIFGDEKIISINSSEDLPLKSLIFEIKKFKNELNK